jgi:hypothetical protein
MGTESRDNIYGADTIRSIAVVTFFEMRLVGRSASAVAGLSRAARARLAGAIFSMIGTIAPLRAIATHQNVTLSQWPLHDSRKAAGEGSGRVAGQSMPSHGRPTLIPCGAVLRTFRYGPR